MKVYSISQHLGMSFLAILATGCLAGNNQQFFESTSVVGSAISADPWSPAPTPANTAVAVAFKKLKPAIAVRGASCLMCHANVQANVITDFGFGDAYFLDPASDARANGSYYFNHALSSWQSAQITGSLIVPKVQMDRSQYDAQLLTVDPARTVQNMSLAEFIQAPTIADMTGYRFGMNGAITQGITSTDGPVVKEQSSIYIGAPTETEILSLAPQLVIEQSGFATTHVNGMTYNSSLPLSGLEVAGGVAGAAYVRNSSSVPFVCAGDVVVKGTLFLNSPDIITDDQGCRLYVSGSVFVQGQIQYDGTSGTSNQNLQITSARAIMMGFDSNSVIERMELGGDRTWALPYGYTREAGSNFDKHSAILADSQKILDLQDAGSSQISFQHLLLNAPEVHSRYIGEFTGAVIGEVVIFRLGQFAFSFDSVFENVAIFPALTTDILVVTE